MRRTPKGQRAEKPSVYVQARAELCWAEREGPAGQKELCRKNLCPGSSLGYPGCPDTDSGLGKNTPQTGREAAGRLGWRPLRAAVPALPLPSRGTEAGRGQRDPAGTLSELCASPSSGRGALGAHLCMWHHPAHTFRFLLQSVLREVHEGHGTVLCGSINNLGSPERVSGGAHGLQRDWGSGRGQGSGVRGQEAEC